MSFGTEKGEMPVEESIQNRVRGRLFRETVHPWKGRRAHSLEDRKAQEDALKSRVTG